MMHTVNRSVELFRAIFDRNSYFLGSPASDPLAGETDTSSQ
jgi:hypothetical protein